MAKFRLRKEDRDDQTTAPRVSADFFGTLRSEFDEPEVLPDGFIRLARHVQDAVIAYQDERIDRRDLAERLKALKAKDVTGAEWTIGSTSQRWYRKAPGGEWAAVPAPTQSIGEPVDGEWNSPTPYPDLVREAPEKPATYADEFDAGLDALLRDEAPAAAEEVAPPPMRLASEAYQPPMPRVEEDDTDNFPYAYPADTDTSPNQTIDDLLADYQPTSTSSDEQLGLDLADLLGEDEAGHLTPSDVTPAEEDAPGDVGDDPIGSYLDEVSAPVSAPVEDVTEDLTGDDVILDEDLFWNGND